MKKVLLICSMALIFVSCKKDYSCECTRTVSITDSYYDFDSTLASYGSTYVDGYESYTFTVKKKESEDKCDSYEKSTTEKDYYGSFFYGGDKTTSTACSIK